MRSGTANPLTVIDGQQQERSRPTSPNVIAPTGTLTSWNNTFSWTGVGGATWYFLDVQTSHRSPGAAGVVHGRAGRLRCRPELCPSRLRSWQGWQRRLPLAPAGLG